MTIANYVNLNFGSVPVTGKLLLSNLSYHLLEVFWNLVSSPYWNLVSGSYWVRYDRTKECSRYQVQDIRQGKKKKKGCNAKSKEKERKYGG